VIAGAAKPYTSVIHAMWTTVEIPSRWQQSASTWLSMNTDFAYCLWTHAELEELVADEYPWLLSTYRGYRYFIQRCDVARYALLYLYGGTYVDLDVVCRTSLSTLFASAPVEAEVVVVPTLPSGYGMYFIAVRRPRDPTIRGVISGLRRAAASRWYLPIPYAAILMRSGPRYFTRRLDCQRSQGRIFVIPWPLLPRYVKHIGGASWHTWDARFISYVFLRRHKILQLGLLAFAVAAIVHVFRTRRSIANTLRETAAAPVRFWQRRRWSRHCRKENRF